MYLIGRGRRWRVNCHGQFECSCPLEEFDRWANSRGSYRETVPSNQMDFLSTVLSMVKETENLSVTNSTQSRC